MNRQDFLKANGLDHDPFALWFAEREVGDREILGHLFRYFVYPKFKSVSGKTKKLKIFDFNDFRSERHALIFGGPGSGKTALRLVIEANIRATPERSLVVACLCDSQDITDYNQLQKTILARSIARDLFIQVCEQFNPIQDQPSEKQIQALREQVKIADLGRLVDRMLDPQSARMPYGIASCWSFIEKQTVLHVDASEPLYRLLRQMQEEVEEPLNQEWNGEKKLEHALEAAHLWGYDRIIVLVDRIENNGQSAEQMLLLIKPLLNNLEGWAERKVFFKFMLSTEIENNVTNILSNIALNSRPAHARIVWDQAKLGEFIRQRFIAAGTHHGSLGALLACGYQEEIDRFLLLEAHTPREILRRTDLFLDWYISVWLPKRCEEFGIEEQLIRWQTRWQREGIKPASASRT